MRQTLSQGNGKDRGVLVSENVLKTIFPISLTEKGFQYETNGSITIGQEITLNLRTLFSKGLINKYIKGADGKTLLNANGSYQMTAFDKNQFMDIRLPQDAFGTAVSDNPKYSNGDSVSKSTYADQVFKDRTAFNTITAKVNAELSIIKKLIYDKAISLGLVTLNYDPIDWEHPEIKNYFETEIKERLIKLLNEQSLWALTKPGGLLDGAAVYKTESKGFTSYRLYLK